MAAALLCTLRTVALAQPPNPNYTADMPSVDRVKAEIQGSDPTDTLARQCAVFSYLSTTIQRIKYNRTVSGPYTPEELRVMGAYELASYQIKQDYNKSHTAAEADAFDRLSFRYQMDKAFYQDWNKRLVGPQSKAAYQRTESELGARQAAHVESIRRANEEARKAPAGAGGGREADPAAVATRRCLELGGVPSTCIGKGFKAGVSGLMNMVGINLDAMTGPGKAGLVLNGRYHDPRALASLIFGTTAATVSGCGKLVDEERAYTITRGPDSLVVTVANEPRDLVLTSRPDGGLSGPGLVDVKGKVISGYHTETTTLYVDGQPSFACGGPCSKSVRMPDYALKIERCAIGSLNPPPPPSPASASSGFSTGFVGVMVGIDDTAPPPLPGLRMTGKYGGSGLLFEFSENSVILDCGQAHARQPYTVENARGDVRIHVQNSGAPFTLTLGPNNTLRGSGSTTVNGRLVTGMQGANVTYAPRSESCEIGTFAPASAGESPAPSASAPSAPAAPPAGSARLLISSAYPAGANPLAGATIFLYKDSLANVLRKAGVSVAANATAGQALRAMLAACKPPADCQATAASVQTSVAGRALFGSEGRAVLNPPVPPGRYFVSAVGRNRDSALVWDIRVDLKAGDNSVVLEQGAAEIVR